MHYIYVKPRLVEQCPSYRVHFVLKNLGGLPQTGQVASMDIWRVKLGESPATQIMTSGVGATTQTVTEVDSTNMPGLYELKLAKTDLDRPGPLSLLITSTLSEDTLLHCDVWSRSGAF